MLSFFLKEPVTITKNFAQTHDILPALPGVSPWVFESLGTVDLTSCASKLLLSLGRDKMGHAFPERMFIHSVMCAVEFPTVET